MERQPCLNLVLAAWTMAFLAAGCCCTSKQSDVHVTSGPFTVYAAPVTSSGSNTTCQFSYVGYVTYIPTNAWGWKPDTNSTHSASDGGGRTDTLITYLGRFGDSGCAQTTVNLPSSPPSTYYRFTIFFPNNLPATNYPISLNGFNP